MYLLLLFFITFANAQSSSPIKLQPDRTFTRPLSIPPSEKGAFQKIPIPLSVIPSTTLLAEIHLKSVPPHSGPIAPFITASTNSTPPDPDTASPCSQQQPCVSTPFDHVAFYTRADTATITLPLDHTSAFVVIYNWKLPGLPPVPLTGTLHLRMLAQVDQDTICPGTARGNVCRGRGSCVDGQCRCQRGWGSRSCGTRFTEAPKVSDRPVWDGKIRPMRESAVVTIPAEGVTYLWRVSGRSEFRARLLKGDFVDGDRKSVDGGGGVFKMIVKKPFENLGSGLEEGTRLPSLYDEQGVGRVVASGDVYEVVSVGNDDGDWLMGLMVDGGEAVVSVNVRRCGGDGLLDCAFGEDDGRFPVGVVVGVSVVGVVLLSVVVVLCLCWSRRRERKDRKSASGAWTDVDLSRIEAMHVRDDPLR